MKLTEIEDRQAAIRAELSAMDANEGTSEETDGDVRDTLIHEYEGLDERKVPIVARMEKLKLIQRAAGDGGPGPAAGGGGGVGTLERGDGGDGGGHGGPAEWSGRTPEFMTRIDPFAEIDKVRRGLVSPRDTVSRAQAAIDMHAKRGLLTGDRGEECTRKATTQPMIARHMLLFGGDQYIDDFRTYLNDPMGEGRVAERSLTMGTASGGYLLPYVLDPTIVLTNAGSTNPYRRLAEVKTTTSNAWQGVNSAGVQMAWLDEVSTASDNTPTVGQIQIYPKKGAAWVVGSFEVMGDTNYADQLPGMLADGKDIFEEQAFAVGTGGVLNAGQPNGIMHALGTAQRVLSSALGGTVAIGSFPTGSAGAVVNIYGLNAALGPRFRQSASVGWVANITNINAIRALDQFGGGSFWANLTADQPERLLNKPIAESPSLTATATVGTALSQATVVFGDWSKYYIIDRIGSTMLFDPLVKSSATPNKPTGEQGWFYYWRVGADVATPNAFRWLANGTG